MIDFLDQQNKIKQFIETNYKNKLNEIGLSDKVEFIDDFIDLDKYKKSIQLFFDFNTYNFNSLSNQSNSEDLELKIYLTFKGGNATDLKENMLKYTQAFYGMFENTGGNFDGLVDFGIIEKVNFYNATEQNINIKLSEMTIKIKTER